LITNKKISVVVPCYKDALNIRELVRRLVTVLEETTSEWEIIYINDNSPDNANEILKEVAEEEPRIKVISFSRNFGVMAVFRAGIDYSKGDAIVLMDGDLQDPPELIPELVKKWLDGYLVVYGIRESRDERLYRKIGYKYFYKILNYLSSIDIPLNAGEFALIDSSVANIISMIEERDFFLRGIRTWVGFPQTGVSYHRPDRFAGKTTQNLFSYFSWATKAISSFSIKPLKFISILALMMSAFMMLLFATNITLYLFGITAPKGFFTLLFVFLFGSATQLVALAIISEYMIHIFNEVKRRPRYIVQSVINSSINDSHKD
jgi:dolichol-phosphate mannosyltransferase